MPKSRKEMGVHSLDGTGGLEEFPEKVAMLVGELRNALFRP